MTDPNHLPMVCNCEDASKAKIALVVDAACASLDCTRESLVSAITYQVIAVGGGSIHLDADMWARVTFTTYPLHGKTESFSIECDSVEEGMAYLWQSFCHRFRELDTFD